MSTNAPDSGSAEKTPVSALAVASLVFAFLCQPVGLLLGIAAIARISLSGGRIRGMKYAVRGTLISAVLGVVAAIAIPGLLRSRIGNGHGPSGTLKSIASGQEQFKSANALDLNANGVGEYGFLSELAGTRPLRGGGPTFSENPYIPSILGEVNAKGVAMKAGWCFKVYLPGRDAKTAEEEGTGAAGAAEGAADREATYVAYAWPVSKSEPFAWFFKRPKASYMRGIYAIDPQGLPYRMEDSPFEGPEDPPPWDFALGDRGWEGYLGGKVGWEPRG